MHRVHFLAFILPHTLQLPLFEEIEEVEEVKDVAEGVEGEEDELIEVGEEEEVLLFVAGLLGCFSVGLAPNI